MLRIAKAPGEYPGAFVFVRRLIDVRSAQFRSGSLRSTAVLSVNVEHPYAAPEQIAQRTGPGVC
ncbi:protein of unknown function [Pararobbsia alpina]